MKQRILFSAALLGLACLTYGTALGDLAAQMKAGEWRQLQTVNLVNAVSSADVGGGASGGELGYAEDGAWDPATEKFFFVGGDHNWNVISTKFISYSASANTWTVMPRPPWATFLGNMHGYDHNAIDAARGIFYCRRAYADRMFEKYNIGTGAWTALPANNVYGYNYACCGGVEYFPDMQGLFMVQSNADGDHAVGLYLFGDSQQQWRKIGASLPIPDGNNFAEYNPIRRVMVCGGSSYLYKVDAAGAVTALRQAPLTLGVNHTIFTVDPVSGDFLVFGRDGSFYVYNVVTDTWARQPGSNFFNPVTAGGSGDGGLIWHVVAVPVSNYGVNLFVKYNGSSSAVYLYKHSGATGVETGVHSGPELNIEVSPNPVGNEARIRLPAAARNPVSVKIVDIRGNAVKNFNDIRGQNFTWRPGRLSRGVYILQVIAGQHRFNKRFLIQ